MMTKKNRKKVMDFMMGGKEISMKKKKAKKKMSY